MAIQSLFLIILTALLWGSADFLRKIASGQTNNQLLTFIFNLGAVIFPLILLVWSMLKNEAIKYNMSHVFLSLAGGLLVGAGGVILFALLSKEGQVTAIFPLVRVVSLVVVTMCGILFLSESVNLKLILGLIFSLLGIYFILSK